MSAWKLVSRLSLVIVGGLLSVPARAALTCDFVSVADVAFANYDVFNVGAPTNEKIRRVTVTDLELSPPPPPVTRDFKEEVKAILTPPPAPVDAVINVYRNMQRAEYHVKPGS